MKKFFIFASVNAIFLLAGCAAPNNPDLGMKIEGINAPRVLLGEFQGSVALIYGDPTNARIQASDGDLNCDGVSNSGQFSTDMNENKIKHTFRLTCSDGRSGNAVVNLTASRARISGIGIGSLNDGSRVKIIIGDRINGTLGW